MLYFKINKKITLLNMKLLNKNFLMFSGGSNGNTGKKRDKAQIPSFDKNYWGSLKSRHSYYKNAVYVQEKAENKFVLVAWEKG